ncbi:hypothetical protein [Caldalkalibacillus salinus]|uniref:hypothetical protein n=1 Tax=Caldalkalibacillus salinus TaxID=2803787 RepID=UPI001921AD84|nr:hypothetical protein [Caldalkalibacillus salinus]
MYRAEKRNKGLTIGLALLVLPLLVTIVLVYPTYAEFEGLGEVVNVRELGIQGSVYLTYIQSGYTSNIYERIITGSEFPHADFYPLEKEDVFLYEDWIEDWEEEREEVVVNVVEQADAQTERALDYDLVERTNAIIAETEEYIGDSFGLMVAIGLVEEMNEENFSRRQYKIAGTGTLEWDQTVGSVGGIKHKLLTAELNEVDFFFVPKDKEWYEFEEWSNQFEAERLKEEYELNLEVVPVADLDEALSFLRMLPSVTH